MMLQPMNPQTIGTGQNRPASAASLSLPLNGGFATRTAGLALALAAALALAGPAQAGPRPAAGPAFGHGPGTGPGTVQVDNATVDETEAAELIWTREEEKLARDVYDYLNGLWASPVFSNIARAEQQHMDAVKFALDRYQLADPATPDLPGVYADANLQALYTRLTVAGQASRDEALRVGAYIEELDIRDVTAALAATDNTDLQGLYESLLAGSRNHLRAFVGQLETAGVVYAAQVLDQATVDGILDSPMERGGAGGVGGAGGPGGAQGPGGKGGPGGRR